MTEQANSPGWDAQAIHQIAATHYGGLLQMFKHHGWPERGSDMMPKVQTRVVETYGTVRDWKDYVAYWRAPSSSCRSMRASSSGRN
jgi:hypothetical protein